MEDYVYVLDYLPKGRGDLPPHKRQPMVYGLGEDQFTLLELVPKKGVFLQPYEEVYIGEGKREKIHHIVGKLPIDKLTSTANSELEFVVTESVNKNEQNFVDFYNKAQPDWNGD